MWMEVGVAPQFNLLTGRFDVVGDNWAFASRVVQDGMTFIALTVRQGKPAYVERRRVKGVEITEYN